MIAPRSVHPCGEEADSSVPPPPGLAATLCVVGAVGVLVALTVWAQVDDPADAGQLALDITVGVAACALLPVLLRRPVVVAVALAVLAAVSPAATPAATMSLLFVAQRRRFPVAVAVGALGVLAHAARHLWRPDEGLSFTWWLVLLVVAHAALVGWGALSQARWALVASLRDRARRAEAEQGRRVAEARTLERTRIAREMHDVLAHRLSLLATYAGALEYRPDAPPEQLSRAAGVVRTGVHQALDELREVITVLRDDDPDDDAGGRPQPVLADVPRLIEESRDAGARVDLLNRVKDTDALPGSLGRTAFRVVQEGLTNARKHAAGQPVQVVLDGMPGAQLRIELSNRLPADPSAPPAVAGTGTGLVGLTERVQLAGGRLDHQTTAAGEFRLHAWLPWPR